MASIKLEITVPDGATTILLDHINSSLGDEAEGLTPKAQAEKFVNDFLQNIYVRQAKAKGGRDFNVAKEAA